MMWLLNFLFFSAFFWNEYNTELIVNLPNGQILGRQEVTFSKVTYYAFQQIPYGKPPVGDLRFLAPQPAESWEGVLDCTKDQTKICMQMYEDDPKETEDCLYLNVYTPVEPGTNASLPVMYWIYGGAFLQGQAPFWINGPHRFIEEDVILVDVNYRTGPFGFLSSGDEVMPGNAGLKDQALGLKWVNENIHLFGGDPEKVTIFGQSAGAASVSYLMLSRQLEGLFRAAIAQSGSALSPWAYQREAREIAYALASRISPSFTGERSSKDLLEFLQTKSAADIDQVVSTWVPEGVSTDQVVQGFLYAPVIEVQNEGALITRKQYELMVDGNFTRVPLIVGICSEEMLSNAENITQFQETLIEYEKDLTNLVPNDLHIDNITLKADVGEEVRKIYTDGALADDISAAVRYYSDAGFNRGNIRAASMMSKFIDVYFYQFSYFGLMSDSKEIILNGTGKVTHSGDWHYEWVVNNASNINLYPEADGVTSKRLLKLLTDFAKYLNPTPEPSELLQNITWPKLTNESFSYLDIDTDLSIKENPKDDTYKKWVNIYETYGVGLLDTY